MMKKPEKKAKKDWFGSVSKVAILLILVMAIAGFTLNMGFFSIFKTVNPGSTVRLDYTIRDNTGSPIISSNRQVVQGSYETGTVVGFTDPLLISANATYGEAIYPIDVYYPGGSVKFAIFPTELEIIGKNVIGMHINEQRTVIFEFAPQLIRNFTAEQFEMVGGNFTRTETGDRVPLGFSETPVIAVDNTTPEIAIRITEVIEKNEQEIILQYGYASVDVTIQDILN